MSYLAFLKHVFHSINSSISLSGCRKFSYLQIMSVLPVSELSFYMPVDTVMINGGAKNGFISDT